MSVIVLDGSGWNSVADFYRATLQALGARSDALPATAEEFIEYLILESSEKKPPYTLRVANAQHLPEPVRQHILHIASRLRDAQGAHLDQGLEDISLEILPPSSQ